VLAIYYHPLTKKTSSFNTQKIAEGVLKNRYRNPSKSPTNNDKNTYEKWVCNSQGISWL